MLDISAKYWIAIVLASFLVLSVAKRITCILIIIRVRINNKDNSGKKSRRICYKTVNLSKWRYQKFALILTSHVLLRIITPLFRMTPLFFAFLWHLVLETFWMFNG